MLEDGVEPRPIILLLIDDVERLRNPFLFIVLQERTHGPLVELAPGDAEPFGELLGRIEERIRYRDGGLHEGKYNSSYTIVKRYFEFLSGLIPKRNLIALKRRTQSS